MSGSRSPIRYGTECLNQHCDHIPGFIGGFQVSRGRIFSWRDSRYIGFGNRCIWDRHDDWGADGKTYESVFQNKINPLIGAAGVSAVPMAARVANKVGIESDPDNFLIMHAMGPNVAGVIGSTIAAGVLIQFAA